MKQNTQEWLEFRKQKIGASDASIILGINPWKTPNQLWEEKLGVVSNDAASWNMKRGIELEPIARNLFMKKTGEFVFPEVIMDDTYPFLIASLDGISFDKKTVVEIKCPGKTDHDTALSGKIPEKYYPQLQHQCYVAKVEKVFYCSFDGANIAIVECHADRDYIKNMIEKEIEFYKCMTEFIPPTMTERDYTKRSDALWVRASQRYIEAKSKSNEIERELEEARQGLLQLSNEMSSRGNGIEVRKCTKKGRIDYQKILDSVNIDVEKYRKDPEVSWTVRVC